ncbi:hypothetical protein SLS62_004618 [Diatrype stigma]|uniref:Major facilitator superfamily (MFS) profile domain-containing protein n=1 Tax=Diatrype stigma TaxID=117547 RepID=A0AAN9UST4_9PEZI
MSRGKDSNPGQYAVGLDSGTDGDVEKEASLNNQDIVDWDGPSDPNNPLNWPPRKRFGHIVIVAMLSMTVNLASTMFAPGVESLSIEFELTTRTLATLSVTVYLLGFALGPMIISPLSELFGRLPVYHVANVVFVAFVVGNALSKNIAQFIVFRFLSGFAGATPLTIGGGTIADVFPPKERGLAAALFGLGPLMGPVIGPVIGGFVAAAKGWRWTFWLMAIIGGAVGVISVVFMRETNPYTLLERKAARLRAATGNENLKSKLARPISSRQLLLQALTRPTMLLLFSPIVLIMSLYVALVFGLLYLLFTTFTDVFEGQYGWSSNISGLAYLGLGIGELLGLVVFGALDNRVLQQRMKADGVTHPRPEYRLILMIWFSPVIGVGLLIYGWTAYYNTHWIAPLIGTLIVGFGSFFVIMPSQLYLVDLFGSKAAASALGANILLRSLSGTFLPLAGPSMYDTLHFGWGNTLLGLLAFAFVPAPIFFYKYGEQLRSKTTIQF